MEWIFNYGRREWVCEHEVGHPSKQAIAAGHSGVHGCEGCCGRPDFPQHEPPPRKNKNTFKVRNLEMRVGGRLLRLPPGEITLRVLLPAPLEYVPIKFNARRVREPIYLLGEHKPVEVDPLIDDRPITKEEIDESFKPRRALFDPAATPEETQKNWEAVEEAVGFPQHEPPRKVRNRAVPLFDRVPMWGFPRFITIPEPSQHGEVRPPEKDACICIAGRSRFCKAH